MLRVGAALLLNVSFQLRMKYISMIVQFLSGFQTIFGSIGTNTSTQLFKAQVATVPLSECNATYLNYNAMAQSIGLQNGISENQYCARDPVGRRDTCKGDSGGPLQVFRNPLTSHVVGIVSFGGAGCGTLPTIYTRVAFYAEWIALHVDFEPET